MTKSGFFIDQGWVIGILQAGFVPSETQQMVVLPEYNLGKISSQISALGSDTEP